MRFDEPHKFAMVFDRPPKNETPESFVSSQSANGKKFAEMAGLRDSCYDLIPKTYLQTWEITDGNKKAETTKVNHVAAMGQWPLLAKRRVILIGPAVEKAFSFRFSKSIACKGRTETNGFTIIRTYHMNGADIINFPAFDSKILANHRILADLANYLQPQFFRDLVGSRKYG